MSTQQVWELLERYWNHERCSVEGIQRRVGILTRVCDEFSFPLKLYDAERLTSGEERRVVLDITSVTAKNVKSTAERTITLEAGTTLIYGPNDAGKTTMQEAARYAIGGAGAVDRIDEAMLSHGADTMMVRVEVGTQAGTGFVQRSLTRKVISRGKDKGSAKVERNVTVSLGGKVADGAREAEQELAQYLGGDTSMVLELAFLRQGLFSQVMDERPAERKEAVLKLIGLAAAESTRQKLASALKTLEERASRAASAVPEARSAQIKARLDEIERDPKYMVDVTHGMDAAPHAAASRVNVESAQKSVTEWGMVLDNLRARFHSVKALPPKCEMCAAMGKDCDLTPEMKSETLARINSEGKGHKASLEAAQKTLDDARASLARNEHDLANWHEARNAKEALKAEAKRLIAEHDEIKKSLPKKGDDAWSAEDLALLAEVTAAFGKDGLPLWLAREHVGRINAIARELSEGDRFLYQFGDEFEIQMFDQVNVQPRVDPVFASGSSRERGALVLLAARARYLAELAGLEIPLIWIDELAFQDSTSCAALLHTLKRLTKWFPKVVLAASQWNVFGMVDAPEFDHEISIGVSDVARYRPRAGGEVTADDVAKHVEAHASASPDSDDHETHVAAYREAQSLYFTADPAATMNQVETPTSTTDLERELAEMKQRVDGDLGDEPGF